VAFLDPNSVTVRDDAGIILGRPGQLSGASAALTWLRATVRDIPDLVYAVHAISRKCDLSIANQLNLSAEGLWLSYRTSAWRLVLSVLRPRIVIVDFDRSRLCQPLVLAAQQLGIPSLTLIHGSIGRDGYVPVLATMVVCTGQRHLQSLLELGVDADRIRIIGAPGLENPAETPPTEAARRRPQFTVLFGSTASGSSRERVARIREFGAALRQCDGCKGVVRPHPSEDASLYATVAEEFSLAIEDPLRTSVAESMSGIDLVVTTTSTLADNAVLSSVPAITIRDPSDTGQDGIREVGLGSLMPPIPWSELPRLVLNLRNNSDAKKRLQSALQKASRDLVDCVGDEARARFLMVVDQLITTHERSP
jgi:hypothetical protein